MEKNRTGYLDRPSRPARSARGPARGVKSELDFPVRAEDGSKTNLCEATRGADLAEGRARTGFNAQEGAESEHSFGGVSFGRAREGIAATSGSRRC